MTSAQVSVTPEDLDTFAKHVESVSDQLKVTKDVLANTHFDPLNWGLVGMLLFGIAAMKKVEKSRECIEKYEASLREAADKTRNTADTYRQVDSGNANTFGGR